jgi:hypothetical protein
VPALSPWQAVGGARENVGIGSQAVGRSAFWRPPPEPHRSFVVQFSLGVRSRPESAFRSLGSVWVAWGCHRPRTPDDRVPLKAARSGTERERPATGPAERRLPFDGARRAGNGSPGRRATRSRADPPHVVVSSAQCSPTVAVRRDPVANAASSRSYLSVNDFCLLDFVPCVGAKVPTAVSLTRLERFSSARPREVSRTLMLALPAVENV